jgi:hypothetical protein
MGKCMSDRTKLFIAILGIIINMIGVIFIVLYIMKFHNGWDTAQLSPDISLKYGERLLRNDAYFGFPMAALTMIVSTIGFWLIRK